MVPNVTEIIVPSQLEELKCDHLKTKIADLRDQVRNFSRALQVANSSQGEAPTGEIEERLSHGGASRLLPSLRYASPLAFPMFLLWKDGHPFSLNFAIVSIASVALVAAAVTTHLCDSGNLQYLSTGVWTKRARCHCAKNRRLCSNILRRTEGMKSFLCGDEARAADRSFLTLLSLCLLCAVAFPLLSCVFATRAPKLPVSTPLGLFVKLSFGFFFLGMLLLWRWKLHVTAAVRSGFASTDEPSRRHSERLNSLPPPHSAGVQKFLQGRNGLVLPVTSLCHGASSHLLNVQPLLGTAGSILGSLLGDRSLSKDVGTPASSLSCTIDVNTPVGNTVPLVANGKSKVDTRGLRGHSSDFVWYQCETP